MALLSRLFSSKKNNKPSCNTNAEKNERSSWKPFTFGKDQVRVLLFRECDWRGRKLLFDSNAVQKVALENSCKLRFASRQKPDKCKKEGFVEVTNGYGYQYTKPSSDAKLLEEMMFGAVAMTFRGTALKVHSMATPNRLMCTKVFPSPVVTHTNRRTSDRSLEDSYGSSVNSMSEYFSQNSGSESLLASGPLDVPMGEIARPKASRYNSLEGDSGFCGDFSLQSVSSVGSPSYWTPLASPEARNSTGLGSLCGGGRRQQSGGSLSSLQRRWIRNMSTSLELGLSQTDEVQSSCTGHHRRTKLGLAVVLTLTEERTREMEVFLFEHMSIIEAMIERLRFTVEKAYLRKETFVHLMHEGWADMQQSVCDMLCSQRLQCPIWLTLTSTENKSHTSLASMFLQDLCILISTLDTKATNFFVSTLVTGILTHHLGWVNTVWPTNAQTSSTADNTEATDSLNDLLKSHPYNPLWAQLGDLYGALGSPTKIAKTIITTNGRKTDCVGKLLACMTYFIRCGEVRERTSSKQDPDDQLLTALTSAGEKKVIAKPFSKLRTRSDETVCARDDLCGGVGLRGGSSGLFASSEDDCALSRDQDSSSCTLQGGESLQTVFCPPSSPVASCADLNSTRPDGKTDGFLRVAHSSGSAGHVAPESPVLAPDWSGKPEECSRPDLCLPRPGSSGLYADVARKGLDVKLETEQNKFSAHALGDGNFASPAGAEWEKEDYPTSPVHGGRTGVEREASDGLPSASHSECEYARSRVRMGDETDRAVGDGRRDEGRTESEDLHRPTYGLRSMRRTSRCVSQMSDLKAMASCSKLYPSIDGLAKMENVRLDSDSDLRGFGSDTLDRCPDETGENLTELISDKVSKLCRVPTMAVMFHLEPEPEDFVRAVSNEGFETRRLSSERQTRAADDSNLRRSDYASLDVQRASSSEVLFVLGDDEELKGIGKLCSRSNSEVDTSNLEVGDVWASRDVGEPRVVTVRSAYIDLEDECPSVSASLPAAKHRRPKKSAKILRRHTEKYCDRCKTLLKLKCGDEGRTFVGCGRCRDAHASDEPPRSLEPREDNAIFEQYDPSDEEILGPQVAEPQVPASPRDIAYGDLHIVDLPLPRCDPHAPPEVVGLAASLLGGVSPRYLPDLVLQGCASLPPGWEAGLRRDLTLAAKLPLLGHEVTEAVCIVANTHTWEVQLVSSHAYVVDKPGTFGVCVGMSQLVANMLESLVHLWRLRMPPEHCLLHMESKLRELYLRSQALAELLLTTEFCNMELLTTSLDLEANDVPLLLAVASTHSPQIAHRYGLSFG